MHICIVQRIGLDFRSMRYIKIDIIVIIIIKFKKRNFCPNRTFLMPEGCRHTHAYTLSHIVYNYYIQIRILHKSVADLRLIAIVERVFREKVTQRADGTGANVLPLV